MTDESLSSSGASVAAGDLPGNGRRVPKSPEAFRTISEVADELNLPQHVLRFWESKFNQIRPLKRGGGRRYYRPEDVDLLRRIRRLLYTEGYTIKGVQKVLRENGGRLAPTDAQPPKLERSNSGPVVTVAMEPRAPLTVVESPANAAPRAEINALIAELTEIRDLIRRGRR